MTNEYGAHLDGAGYAESILQKDTGRCYLCGAPAYRVKLDRHEPYGGALRQKSKGMGMWVSLCHCGCHEGPGSVHAEPEKNRELRKDVQRAAMMRYGWDKQEFIRRFGKSELTDEEAENIVTVERAHEIEVVGVIHPGCFAVLEGAPEMPF